jgi:putative transposase
MTRKRYTEEQIIAVLKDAQAGVSIHDLCRKHGISDATFDNWRTKYVGMEASDVKKLHQLEEENRRLKQMVAEQTLKAHRKKLVTPKVKRAAAQWVVARVGLSQRRVCRLVALDRDTLRYRSHRPDEPALRMRRREIAETQRRYGCPRISVRLNHKKIERIDREEELSLRRRARKKSVAIPHVSCSP